eukprot:19387_1
MMFICAKPNEVTSANETCFQLYSRSTAEFCQSDCSRKLNDAISLAKTSTLTWQGNIPNGTCISISRKFDELNLDFVQECAETVPGAPTITRTTPGDREIVVTFAAPAEKGGSAVSNYRLEIDGEQKPNLETTGMSLNFVVDGLKNGQSYTFRVQAMNKNGWGEFSNKMAGTPDLSNPLAPAPIQPNDRPAPAPMSPNDPVEPAPSPDESSANASTDLGLLSAAVVMMSVMFFS